MILDKIIASTKIRVAKAKENLSPSELLKALDKAELKAPNFKNGLMSIDDVSIIAEIKKAPVFHNIKRNIVLAHLACPVYLLTEFFE